MTISASTAFSAPGSPPIEKGHKRRPRAIGEITEIGSGEFTVENQQGVLTVLVDSETKYFNPNARKFVYRI
ncbi:MAG: hypothetical protein N2D54_12050 [Chloroflexota bacterium]